MGSISAKEITKLYPGTRALDNVTIGFESGKIHAFVGKNGSGKSTLLKIFAGAEQPTSGTILLDGEPVQLHNPNDALKKGVATVFQELSVIPSISIAENIFSGRLPTRKSGLIDWEKTYQMAEELLRDLGIDLDARALAGTLTVSQMQMVEIAKAMSTHPKVLQLDEPTSSLSQAETQKLFQLMRTLKEKDVVVIFVTHRLEELWEVSDTCLVLRDGEYIGKVNTKEHTRRDILKMMFGEIESVHRPEDIVAGSETVLKVRNLTRAGKFTDISFELKEKEILGIAGMMGAGRTELLKSLFGADPYQRGEIFYRGQEIVHLTPTKMRSLGFGMVQEDRKKEGLIAYDTVESNTTFASIPQMGKGIFASRRIQRKMYETQRDALSIKTPSGDTLMSALSGGNQQKAIVGRLLNTEPSVLFFDEPSRGIDVSAKQQIFQIIWNLSRQGIASIIVSSELEELLDVCTRIIVMVNGRFVEEVKPEDISVAELYLKCMGE